MESENNLKKHPPWKNAVERICERFESDGYDCFISDEEFLGFLSIEKPKDFATEMEYRRFELSILQRYKTLDALLEERNICLMRGREGFVIVSPKEQITNGYDKHMGKLRRELNKIQKLLTNLNSEMLSMDEEKERQYKLIRTAFIKSATNKKKIEFKPADGEKKVLQLKNS